MLYLQKVKTMPFDLGTLRHFMNTRAQEYNDVVGNFLQEHLVITCSPDILTGRKKRHFWLRYTLTITTQRCTFTLVRFPKRSINPLQYNLYTVHKIALQHLVQQADIIRKRHGTN